ncbi:NAD(P)H-dependent oxidoreductase [Vibrio sp. SCSIO 43140]|uniref:NADPH-dependent FMN reductase n=1 Tax=Vibrio sp. SCSIO 43140 TaxID=2819100 RepID=UPI002075C560|nr:NADPH-dependent FMN reductase [Vibrio sp. SCSIO 43140]USD59283.1 NAD(P)H-dependent oxidoreductase [Vibrio sp. SCSIO 43140]
MKVIAFGASTSSTSINKALATYAAGLIEGADVEVLDLAQFDVPLFSEDKEKEIGQAEGAKAFLEAIQQADALVISFAEHNGHHPAAYKNLFDWATRIDREVFKGIPAVYLATSPGPGGASNVLAAATNSAPYFGGNVKASVSVPSFYDVFDLEAGKLIDSVLIDKIESAIKQL